MGEGTASGGTAVVSGSSFDSVLNAGDEAYSFIIQGSETGSMGDPERFGYYVSQDQTYPQLSDYKTITINVGVPSLADLAIQNGTDYRQLKVYNPWLIKSYITNKYKKEYQIRIPTDS